MKRRIIKTVLYAVFFLCLSWFLPGALPEVTNVQALQRNDGSMIVDISYDLSGGGSAGSMIIVEVSPDGGASWKQCAPGEIAGDFGPEVLNGQNLQISWNAGESYPDEYWLNCLVKITARDILVIMLPGEVPLKLVKIPSGTFTMGSPDTERSRVAFEGPQTEVTLTRDFYMGMYPITQQQWLAIQNIWPEISPLLEFGLGDNYPAYYVSWNDAQDFISLLNWYINATAQGPITVSLPTEAQAEYACRAGTNTRFYFGDSLSVNDSSTDGPTDSSQYPGNRSDYMWFNFNSGISSQQVGQKLPNAFGLYDMHGNIWEWVQDWWHSSYPGGSVTDPEGPLTGDYRVFRGGAYPISASGCRSAYRYYESSFARDRLIGFRIIATRPEL